MSCKKPTSAVRASLNLSFLFSKLKGRGVHVDRLQKHLVSVVPLRGSSIYKYNIDIDIPHRYG